MSISKAAILEALKNVQEPDLKKDLVTLNLVKIISVDGNKIHIEVKVSNPAMHAKQRMMEAVKFAIHRVLGNEFEVQTDVLSLSGEERDGELRRVNSFSKPCGWFGQARLPCRLFRYRHLWSIGTDHAGCCARKTPIGGR
jgi:metal-sulfur cluster biosynthetic enzyme